MFADTFAEFFRHACQSAALLLPFSSSEERLYLEHIITRSRYSTWAFAATFNCPFLISELIFFKESLERDGQSSGETARFACAVCAFLVAFLLPWLRGGKVFPETLWALLVCADLALLLTRPVVIIDGRHMGQAARGTIAKLLVVCSFTFLPLRFFVALVVLTLGVIGSVFASYISGDMMDPLLLGLIGLAALYNLAVFEGQTRRAFRSVLTAQSVATQVFSEDFQRKISSSIQVASSDTFQELFPLSTPRPPQPRDNRDNRDKRRHRSLPSGPTQEEGKWTTAVQKFRSDGHEIKSGGIRSPRSGTESSVRRGRCHHSIEPAPDFIINVASEASEELLGSCILPSLPSQSRSISNYRNGQASSASPALPRPDGEAPRLGHASQRNSLSISKSSEGSQTAEISAVLPMVEVANAQSQTEILWKDGGWHCTRCSKPPAQPAQPAEPARLPAEMKRPQDRRRSRGQGSVASVEAWKKAMETLTHLQGNWQLVYGPENVSPWLERFMICSTTVSCEDVDRPLEMIEAAHPTLGGGILLLDKDEMLHRFGKSGQHLFQRHDTTNLTSLVQRMNEDSDPQWFAPRAVSGEISSMQDLMDALEDAEKRDANVPHAGATPATSSQFH